PLGQVDGVLLERFALALGLSGIDALPAPDVADRSFQRLAAEPGFTQELPGETGLPAFVFREGKQEHFGGDELVAPPGGFLLREVQQVDQFATDLDLATGPADLRQ